jgi:hypothetical protein
VIKKRKTTSATKKTITSMVITKTTIYIPRIGDVVTLKVGSEPMTVVDFDELNQVTVAWKDEGASFPHELTTDAAAFASG